MGVIDFVIFLLGVGIGGLIVTALQSRYAGTLSVEGDQVELRFAITEEEIRKSKALYLKVINR